MESTFLSNLRLYYNRNAGGMEETPMHCTPAA